MEEMSSKLPDILNKICINEETSRRFEDGKFSKNKNGATSKRKNKSDTKLVS
jgi:hypothetical protein